ncbi:MAG: hypothetical protein KF784_15095 [Fimbriimonadaceae bacterium]|nr:hypothetical protein [Fimbriimonadaceae bacterium]
MARPRQLPNLNEYLRERKGKSPSLSAAESFGCMATLGLSVVGSYLFFITAGSAAAFFGFFLSLIVTGFTLHWLTNLITRPKNEDQKRLQSLDKAIEELTERSRSGTLRKILDPHAAAILEYTSKQWARVMKSLADPIWKNDQLSTHWKEARDNAEASMNRAIEDLTIMLTDLPLEQMSKADWFYLYEMSLESLSEPSGTPEITLPSEFASAIDMAKKTDILAHELESVLQRVRESSTLREQLARETSIDSTLAELRALQQAEAELDENHLRLEDK